MAPIIDDETFLSTVNAIARTHRLVLPLQAAESDISSEFLDGWGHFLEICVREHVSLSDDRWKRLTVETNSPYTRFGMSAGGEGPDDPDFRVGLALLMGMLTDAEEDD